MNGKCFVVLTAYCFGLLSSRVFAADHPLVGEWFPLATQGGLGWIKTYRTNGTMVVTFGAAVHFKYRVETNTIVLEDPQGASERMGFTITGNTLTFTDRKMREGQKLDRVDGVGGRGLVGRWAGKHYTGGKQVMHFTANMNCYLSVPQQEMTGTFTVTGNSLTEELPQEGTRSWKWGMADGVLTLTDPSGSNSEQYERKDSTGILAEISRAVLPRGVRITSDNRFYVHADISEVDIENFPALEKLHALFTVYFDGKGATDEKLKALAQLQFTNLAGVAFNDCPLVTDKGIAYVSQIAAITNWALIDQSISDMACATIVDKIRLHDVSMFGAKVSINGLLTVAHSSTIESLGFSAVKMSQADFIKIIATAGPKLSRMDIDMDSASEERLDLAALRQAAKARNIKLYALRNGHGSEL